MYLWRAVDNEGEVLDLLVQRCRETIATEKLLRKRLKTRRFAPGRSITNELRSHGVAFASPSLSADHEQGLPQNNRAEIS